MTTLVRDARRGGNLLAGMAVVAALVLAVSACSSATDEAATQTTEAPSSGTAHTDAAGVAEVEAAIEAIDAPAGPDDGSDAALAWDALMSPEGEYAAAASYAAVIDAFGQVQPYVQIKSAEERHIDALIRQLAGFGIEVPANPYLGNLPAPADLESAARAWATGEVDNVELYDDLLAETTDERLTRVFTNLRRASLEAHLPLFEAAADNGGALTDQQMTDLGHGDHEPGMGGGPGKGQGRGMGDGQGRGQ